MSEVAQRSPVEGLVAKIRSDEFKQQLAAALPEGISVERFARITTTALLDDAARQQEPAKRLTAADPASLYQAVIKCAQDGLMPDGRQAALVKRGTTVSYMPMVGGLRQIAGDHGWTITSHVVAANDEFEHTEEPPAITHKPVRPGADRGPFVACYAVARHRDGRRVQRVLYAAEVQKRKEVATTKNVWNQWDEQMWEKTAARDVFAELPLDPADKRIGRVMEALNGADSSRLLYGTVTESFGELPSGSTPYVIEGSSVSTPPTDEEGVAAGSSVLPDEPATAADEGQPAAATSLPEPTEEETMEALEAGAYTPPSGKYGPDPQDNPDGPKTLAEIYASGPDGKNWLVMCCRSLSADQVEWRRAVEAFCRVALPADYQAAMAWRAEQAARASQVAA